MPWFAILGLSIIIGALFAIAGWGKPVQDFADRMSTLLARALIIAFGLVAVAVAVRW